MCGLLVDLAAVGYPDHGYDEDVVDNVVQQPVVTNTDPPGSACARQFLAASRSGISLKVTDTNQKPASNSGVQFSEFFRRGGSKFNAVGTH